MKTIQIIDLSRSLPSPLQAIFCDTFVCRLRGLMFRSQLDPQQGLLLVEKQDSRLDTAIHMLFVYMDLAVIWINDRYEVVDTCLAYRWHPFYMPAKPARYVLETHPDHLADFRLGDCLAFTFEEPHA